MTRFKFFAAFLGALGLAKAQTRTTGSTKCWDGPCIVQEPAWKTGKARNGQCPVCGTMAPPYQRGQVFCDSGFADKDHPGGCFPSPYEEVRCTRCNCKFEQDAE